MTACSVEPIDSTKNLLTADARATIQPNIEPVKSMDLLESEICADEAPVFVFNFPQNQNGFNPADTDIKIQIETFPGSGVWKSFEDLTYAGAGPEEHTIEILEVGTYSFRVKIGAGGFEYAATLNVVECPDCEESFSYTANGGNSYTFFYTPAEDMANASLVFTFAQSVVASGYDWPDWNGSSSTRTETMDLDACTTYEWEVELAKDCSGNSGNSNVWTDFKVDGVSKKNSETPNITQSCD